MLTLVAVVLVFDLAYEPFVDLAEGLEAGDTPSMAPSLNAKSETREEKDMIVFRGKREANISGATQST